MNIENFIKEQWIPIILAFIFAIIAEIILKPIRRFLGWTRKNIKKLFANKKYEQKYRDWLVEKYKFLNVRGIKTNAPVAIELEMVFISTGAKTLFGEMKLSKWLSIIKDEELKILLPEREVELSEEFLKRIEEDKAKRTFVLKDLFKLPQKRFIIIGAPGSGKTTLLNYLTLKIARRKDVKELFNIEDEFLPIFINLRDIIKEGFLDKEVFVSKYINYIKIIHQFPHLPPQDFFERRLEEGKCIILLDGLDEVALVEERIKVAKWVDELTTAYSKNIFIATSRPYGYESAHLYNDFLELHILDFTPEQVEEFIRYWTKTVEIKLRGDESEFTLREAEKKADDLLKAIKENPKIEVLTVNPLLLTIVSLVHRYRGELPKRRVDLYEECCDVLLGNWDKAKGIEGIAGEIIPRQKRAILEPLAYYLHLNGLREEKKEKFIELFENELPKIGVSKDKTSELLDDIKKRSGILAETKLGVFGFSHLTFQEFLTARYILDNDLENFLVTKKRDKYWLEVILLYCGMRDATNLLNKILNEKEDIFNTNIFLAGRCLAESLSVTPEIRNKITQELFDIFRDENEFNLSKETALEILNEIKDQRIIQEFIQKTKDKESDVRERAAYFLGENQAKEAVTVLIELLKDKDSDVRVSAIYALGEIQAKEAAPSLIELLKDKESDIRDSTVFALGRIRAEDTTAILIDLLNDKESYVRASAAYALGEMQAKEAVLPLIKLLKDEDIDVRWHATDALGQIKAKEAISHLIELLKDKDSFIRSFSVRALGKIKAKEAVSHLVELLSDKESNIRAIAAYALGGIQAKEAVAPLVRLLKDRESVVRARAAYALGKIHTKEALLPLIELLNNKERHVRESVAFALGEIRDKKSIPLLIELLSDKERSVRFRAIYALGEIQAKEAAPSLIELLKDKESDIRDSTVFALGRIRAEDTTAILIDLLNDKESYVRASAAYALGEMQAKEAVLPLIKLLKDEDIDVRWHATDALGQIKAKEAISHLIELLKDKDSYVRRTSAVALGEIGDKRAVADLKLLLNDFEFSGREQVRKSAFEALRKISEKTETIIYKD